MLWCGKATVDSGTSAIINANEIARLREHIVKETARIPVLETAHNHCRLLLVSTIRVAVRN